MVMTVGIDEADVKACQTRNTPSPGLRFLARGVQTRKGADAPLLPWLV